MIAEEPIPSTLLVYEAGSVVVRRRLEEIGFGEFKALILSIMLRSRLTC